MKCLPENNYHRLRPACFVLINIQTISSILAAVSRYGGWWDSERHFGGLRRAARNYFMSAKRRWNYAYQYNDSHYTIKTRNRNSVDQGWSRCLNTNTHCQENNDKNGIVDYHIGQFCYRSYRIPIFHCHAVTLFYSLSLYTAIDERIVCIILLDDIVFNPSASALL